MRKISGGDVRKVGSSAVYIDKNKDDFLKDAIVFRAKYTPKFYAPNFKFNVELRFTLMDMFVDRNIKPVIESLDTNNLRLRSKSLKPAYGDIFDIYFHTENEIKIEWFIGEHEHIIEIVMDHKLWCDTIRSLFKCLNTDDKWMDIIKKANTHNWHWNNNVDKIDINSVKEVLFPIKNPMDACKVFVEKCI